MNYCKSLVIKISLFSKPNFFQTLSMSGTVECKYCTEQPRMTIKEYKVHHRKYHQETVFFQTSDSTRNISFDRTGSTFICSCFRSFKSINGFKTHLKKCLEVSHKFNDVAMENIQDCSHLFQTEEMKKAHVIVNLQVKISKCNDLVWIADLSTA